MVDAPLSPAAEAILHASVDGKNVSGLMISAVGVAAIRELVERGFWPAQSATDAGREYLRRRAGR